MAAVDPRVDPNAVFRLFGLSLHVALDTFQYIGSPKQIPCGVPAKAHACYSLWIEGVHGYLRVPEPGRQGQESLCAHCSFQLACLGGQPHVATPASVPTVSHKTLSADGMVASNAVMVDIPQLTHAPFDEHGA